MAQDEPKLEVRWIVEGFPFAFTREGQARAFALPGCRVYPTLRPVTFDSASTLEFPLASDPNSEL